MKVSVKEKKRSMQYYDKKVIGTRIQQLRKSKSMTQCELAELLDYTTERQLQRIEIGETACSVDKLMEIAQVLEVSTDFLLFEKNIDDDEALQHIFQGRSKKQKIVMIRVLEALVDNLDLL